MDILAFLLTLLGLVLNSKKYIACWPVWMLSNIAWLIHFLPQGTEQAAVAMNLILLGMNTYGWRSWYQTNQSKKETS